MSTKLKGTIYGIIAAVSYGTNPLGALLLYQEGINAHSVLFYRFSLAVVLLALLMLVQKKSFAVNRKELAVLASLGVLFAVSSLTFFTSFHHMDAGISATMLFVYPVMVAVIMAVFFKERLTAVTVFSIALSLAGIALLYKGDGGETLSTLGVVLVMVSSLTYAIYIVVVNRSFLLMSSVKLTFYVLLFCMVCIVIHSFFDNGTHLQLLTTPAMWLHALMLALLPTVISLVLMVMAVHAIGSTPTAILGALEPLTAVLIGISVFGEQLTPRLAIGITLIVIAVLLIIAGKSFSVKRVRNVLGRVGKGLLKHWRWK